MFGQNPIPPGDGTDSRGGLRNYIVASVILFLVAALYLGWVFFQRWQQDKNLQEKAAEQIRAQDRETVEKMGGNRFEILGFYANPTFIRRGDTADLCYSVSNAKSVRLEPQSHAVWPSFSHCVQVSPAKTTTYTFTAEDANGRTKTAIATVEVR